MENIEGLKGELTAEEEEIIEYYNSNKLTSDELLSYILKLKKRSSKHEDFLLNISHDLRGHLNVILSVIQMTNSISIEITDKKVIEYIKIIKRNAYKMLRLINNLIDTTKLENNYYILKKQNLDIISMIEVTISGIDKYAKQKNIQLTFDTNKEECIMAIDPEVLDRIIMNLLSNAIKFSYNDTNIYVNILANNDKVSISIKDEGPGIEEDLQKNIFNRFYQMERNYTGDIMGSGIGLDLVSYLVKSIDGTIDLNSQKGKGCEFIITIPITKVEEKENHCLNDHNSNKIQMLELEFADIY